MLPLRSVSCERGSQIAATEERESPFPKRTETYKYVHEHLDRIKIKFYSNSISGPPHAPTTQIHPGPAPEEIRHDRKLPLTRPIS